MLSKEIITKIKNLEIHTKRLLSGMQVGNYATAQKGTGFEFDQLDEYQYGDDIRFIDWKGSARSQKVLVKRYLEERNRTIMLFVDVSSSSLYSSGSLIRYEIISQIAGSLALVADYGKDLVGLVLFSDKVEDVVPPGSGWQHAHLILQKLFSYTNEKEKVRQTDLNIPFSYGAEARKKGMLAFVISDFIGSDFEKSLRVAQKRFEIVAIRCLDDNEKNFPSVGLISVQDSETKEVFELETKHMMSFIKQSLTERIKAQDKLFKKYGIDVLDVRNDSSFVADMVRYFRRRMRY